jgi:hypothetical protein
VRISRGVIRHSEVRAAVHDDSFAFVQVRYIMPPQVKNVSGAAMADYAALG